MNVTVNWQIAEQLSPRYHGDVRFFINSGVYIYEASDILRIFLISNKCPCFFFQIMEARKHAIIYSKMLAFDGSTIMITLQQTDKIIEFAYTCMSKPSKANILE